MEKENQKTARQYNESLSEVFMTTKEIAKLWNQKVVDKDGKERFRVPRKSVKTQDKPWSADDISKLFERILNKWGLSEYLNLYRYDKVFDLKGELQVLELCLNRLSVPVQKSIENIMKKRDANTFNELMKGLDDVVTRLRKAIEEDGPSKIAYIFNKETFFIDENEIDKEENKSYYDPLYYLYFLYDKKENCTIEEVKTAADELCRMIPFFKDPNMQKEFGTYLENRMPVSNNDFSETDHFYLKRYKEIESKRYKIENKLCEYFGLEDDRWRISDRWKMSKETSCGMLRSKLVIMDYVAEKYIFLLESIDKVREIEQVLISEDGEKSGLSIYSIVNAYAKVFKYKDTGIGVKIIQVKCIADGNDVMNDIREKFNGCIGQAKYITADEKGEYYRNFMREMDSLIDEVHIYYKLYELSNNSKSISEKDVNDYFELTRKKEESRQIVDIAQDKIELRIMQDELLLKEIKQMNGWSS